MKRFHARAALGAAALATVLAVVGSTAAQGTSTATSQDGIAAARTQVAHHSNRFGFGPGQALISRAVCQDTTGSATRFDRTYRGLPVIGGDFNATRNQHDAARQMLPRMRRAGFGDTLGQNGPGYLTFAHCRARHLVDANFFSVNHYGRHLAHYGHHNWVGQDIDYLFASNRLKVTSWELVADHRRGRDTIRVVIPSDPNMVRATIACR